MDTFGLHLHQCTFNENVTVLTDLIKTGNDLNQRDERGETALHVAAKFNKVNAFKLLMDGGANIKAVNKEKRNVLHIAIENNSFQCIHLLLESTSCSSIINKIDCHLLSPLMIAIEKNEKIDLSLRHEQQKVIELLVNHRFMGDVFQEFYSSNKRKYDTHLQCAVECKNEFAIDCMIKKAQESSFESFISCPTFVDLIKLRPNTVNLKNENDQSLLHKAIFCKNFPIIELLIKSNADCNARDAQSCTPLYFAVDLYNQCCTEDKLQVCADLDKLQNCCELQDTYLHTLQLFNNRCVHLAVIIQLVNEGNADVFAENCEGERIFDYFVDDEHICEYLLSSVIKNIRANKGRISATRYIECVYNVFATRVKNFAKQKFELNTIEIDSLAAKFERENIALEMFLSEVRYDQKPLDSCADQEIFNRYFIDLQIKYKKLFINDEKQKTIEGLQNELKSKADFWNSFKFETGFEECEQYGNEMIHDACTHNDVNKLRDALKILKPYEIRETNDNGENALHIATKHASLECIKLLTFENIHLPNIWDNENNTQMDNALRLCLNSNGIMRNRRAHVVACLLEALDKETQWNSVGLVRRNLLPNLVDDLPVNHIHSLRLFTIYYAAYYGLIEVILAIFEKLPHIELQDKVFRDWISASLKAAAAKRYLHIVELLICKIVSYGSEGIKLVDSCMNELISSHESICCLQYKKCDLICILEKCVNLKKIFMKTSVILPHPLSKCGVPALFVFIIEVGGIAIRKKQLNRLAKFEAHRSLQNSMFFEVLFDFYVFITKNKENNTVFDDILDEKSAFNRLHKIRKIKRKCCVQ